MTCRERLKLESPELVREIYAGGAKDCPHNYGYAQHPGRCGDDDRCVMSCRNCWDRECDAPESPRPQPQTRADILDEAKTIVCDGRPQEYGRPEDSFSRIAKLWGAYLGQEITSHDVPMMMALLKVARTKGGKYNRDNYVDLAGYAACAGEIGGKYYHGGKDEE